MSSLIEKLRVLECLVSTRKKPCNSTVEDATFLSLFIKVKVVIHISIKAAVLIIPQGLPEWDDSICQFFLNLISHIHELFSSNKLLTLYSTLCNTTVDLFLAADEYYKRWYDRDDNTCTDQVVLASLRSYELVE